MATTMMMTTTSKARAGWRGAGARGAMLRASAVRAARRELRARTASARVAPARVCSSRAGAGSGSNVGGAAFPVCSLPRSMPRAVLRVCHTHTRAYAHAHTPHANASASQRTQQQPRRASTLLHLHSTRETRIASHIRIHKSSHHINTHTDALTRWAGARR
jgi:hypothetical protein